MNSNAPEREWSKSPSSWRPARLKNAARLTYGDALSADQRQDGAAIVYGSNGKVGTHVASNMRSPAIVVGRKGSFGKVTYAEDGGFAIDTTYFIDRRSSRQHLRWLYYALATLGLDETSQDTGVPGLSREKAHDSRLRLPSLADQKAIADFLDGKTAAIDALIEKKRKLLELLAEKRAALINQAVTKGLDPNVPMKDSGIPWIGEIPAHWGLQQIKRFARPGRKTFTDGDWIETPFITDNGVRLVQTGNIGVGEYRDKGFRYVSEATFAALKCVEVKPGDVLVCRLDGPVGRACLAPTLGVKMITSVDNAILKTDPRHDARYLVYLMNLPGRLGWLQTLSQVGGGHRWRISRTGLGELQLPCPPGDEQQAICDWLDRETSGLQRVREPVVQLIERLQEYRQAVITAAVTGQLDISEQAA